MTQLIQQKLQLIEQMLKKHDLWSAQTPTTEQLSSTTPFAYDVMPFEQWLQFIFIPKIQFLIDSEQALPSSMSISPMAEHVWGQQAQLEPLIELLKATDTLFND
ncbi:YqcC family protein [Parashewanella curva]|uniref:YqcC family protein n=1 Tax=Parashewanella curva TaxID=2338552 RepID=A0A3L8PTW7_9GAMM|nr:YqcC family protein [Parashewanella curva]RLV58850.1 YqcC family protein [Parashewanella curva]